MSFAGQKVVVIGGTSGIGFAAAKAFLAESADVVIGSRSAEKLAKAKQQLGGNGNVQGYELDFRSEGRTAAFFAKIGPFDHLVLTAAEAVMGDFRELALEAVQAAFSSKFWGQYLAIKAAVPYLNEGSSISVTTGLYGRRPPKGASTLAAINSALEGLVRGLALDLAPIRINAVSPGIVQTELYNGMSEEDRKAMFAAVAAALPAGQVALPEDIAKAYVFLAGSKFTTGSLIAVEGGALLT